MLRVHYDKRDMQYWIENTSGERIATFDNLTETALVLRYLKGSNLHKDEALRARSIMQRYDIVDKNRGV